MAALIAMYAASHLMGQQEEKKPPETPPEKQEEKQQEEKQPEPTAAAPVDPKSYKIGPEDILGILFWRQPELSRLVQVRPDGRITLQLVGELQAGEMTPEQLQNSLVKAYSEYINEPDVLVEVRSVRSKKYYLAGQINRAGVFPLVVPITVLEALNAAGGFQEFANTKNIIILRGEKRIKFNYNEVIKGKNLSQNIYVQDGDHIIVK